MSEKYIIEEVSIVRTNKLLSHILEFENEHPEYELFQCSAFFYPGRKYYTLIWKLKGN